MEGHSVVAVPLHQALNTGHLHLPQRAILYGLSWLLLLWGRYPVHPFDQGGNVKRTKTKT